MVLIYRMDLEQINPKKSPIFSCETCNYTTSSRKDFKKHESTRKHLDAVASNQNEPIYPKNPQSIFASYVLKNINQKVVYGIMRRNVLVLFLLRTL